MTQKNKMNNNKNKQAHLSKKLSWLLRHGATKEGLHMQADGFLRVAELLKHPKYAADYTLEILQDLVHNDDKQRFALRQDVNSGEYEIRANQGHSMACVQSEQCLERINHASAVPMAVHGTYMRHWPNIKKEGLKRMQRNHIHFATSDARCNVGNNRCISGFRNDCQLLIYLDVQKALADDLQLYRSTNNVILCAGINGRIEKKYFAKVLDRRTGQLLNY